MDMWILLFKVNVLKNRSIKLKDQILLFVGITICRNKNLIHTARHFDLFYITHSEYMKTMP